MRSVQMVQMMQNYSSLRLFKGWPVQKIFCLPLPQIQVSPMYPLRKRSVSDIPFFLLTGSSSNCAFSFVTRIRFFFIYTQDAVTLMLSVRQANLLLSSLWTQALSPENIPRNYEAISHTYSLMLLFSGDKVR